MIASILKVLLFPGLLFLGVYSFVLEFVDRKVYARMQNRKGPPWYQPLADMLKLVGKKVILPNNAQKFVFAALPTVSLTAVVTAFLCAPVWGMQAVTAYEGDLVAVLYLLSIPTLCHFLAGYNSHEVYSTIGAFRTLTQMFAYEVPLFMAFLSPAILAGSWSITGIAAFYAARPLYVLINLPAFLIALLTSQSKLERAPFDAPEAETEIVGGALVEYSGRYLAYFRATAVSELTVMASVIAGVFLPFFTGNGAVDFALYLVKTFAVVLVMVLLRATMARIRIDQTLKFFWSVLTPVAIAQMILNLLLRGGLGL
ncbi:MAG: NADH-quinone oxidoreductase subunit H [Eubacteriales bacterium]|nr:NADH-quinone oxidoreductase subunit H [Eubacteriales bacterium]